jgi:TPR repeat protein
MPQNFVVSLLNRGTQKDSVISGNFFELGVGVAQDLVCAAEFYRLSAEQGNADGQCCFGICLELGFGVAQDLVDAADFYQLAAEQGHHMG